MIIPPLKHRNAFCLFGYTDRIHIDVITICKCLQWFTGFLSKCIIVVWLKNMRTPYDCAERAQGELGDLEELLPERDSYNGDTQNQTKQKIEQGQL